MKIKDNLDLQGYLLQNFCVDNYDSLDSISNKGDGRMVFLTGNSTDAKYRHVNVWDGTNFKALAYLEDVAMNDDFIALQEKVALLAGDVDTDAIISNMKEVSAFLEGFAEDASLMDYLNTELGKKLNKSGGTITGALTIKTGVDAKLVLDNTDADTNYSLIDFRQNGVSVGMLGILKVDSTNLAWNGKTLLHSGNVGEYKAGGLVSTGLSNVDLNDYKSSNRGASLYWASGNANVTHGAKSGSFGMLVLPTATTLTSQLMWVYNSIYFRSYNPDNETWYDWKTIAFTDSDITGKSGNSDKLGGKTLAWVQGNGLKIRCVKTAKSDSPADANVDLEGGGMIYSYSNTTHLTNGPSGMGFGHIWQVGSYGNNVLDAQLAWDINHGSTEDVTRKLWWRARDSSNGWTYAKWHQIAFTDSTVDKAKQLVNDSGYPIINLGASTFYIGSNINSTHNVDILGKVITLRYGANASNGLILNSSGNVTIGASDLTATGAKLYVAGAILISNNSKYQSLHSNGENKVHLLFLGTDNNTYLGYGSAELQKDTVIDGNSIKLRYGSHSNGFILNSNGNVLIGTTEDNGSGAKLQVKGVATAHLLRFVNNDGTTGSYLGRPSSGHDNILLYLPTANDFYIATNGTERMRVNAAGNVTIGGSDSAGTNENNKLFIYGGAVIRAYNTGSISLGSRISNSLLIGHENFGLQMWANESGSAFAQVAYTNGTETAFNLCLQPLGGNVGIGTSNPTEKLHVVGNLHVTGNIIADGEVSAGGAGEEGSTSGSGAGAFHSESIAVGATQTTIAHGLGTDDIVVSIYEKDATSGLWSMILTDIEITDANSIRVTFGSATTVEHKVVIMGAVA